jgi:glycosyltransferase involved in cell wall biosynthesis
VLPAFLSKLRLPACPWVQKSFHIIPATRPVSRWAQRLSHVLIRAKGDMLIADNALLRDELVQRGIPRERMRLNYPGIDAAYYQSFPAAGAEERLYDAVYLGRIQASKGIFSLVDIWHRVCRRLPSARLGIIGRGDPRTADALQKRITDAGLADNILLLGYLETVDAVRVLKQSKVFVSPSVEEGFGMAILEAIAAGLPVVAWDLPVYREVFPQGLVGVPPGDPQAFADAITGLLDDPYQAASIVAQATNLPARYDWDRVAAREWQLVQYATLSRISL